MEDGSWDGGNAYATGIGDGELSGIFASDTGLDSDTGLAGRTNVRTILSATTRLEFKY